jgi:hypothetical protein
VTDFSDTIAALRLVSMTTDSPAMRDHLYRVTTMICQFEDAMRELEAGVKIIEQGAVEKDQAIAHLEQSLREKDDIIQAQYAELVSTRASLDKAVDMLNEMRAELDRRKAA